MSPLLLGLYEILELDSWLIIFRKKMTCIYPLTLGLGEFLELRALVNIFFMKDGLYAVRPW